VVSLVFILFFPVHFLLTRKPVAVLRNSLLVLTGRKTWIGYNFPGKNLPALRAGVLAPNGPLQKEEQKPAAESLRMIDRWYAMDYEPLQDLKLIFRNYRHIGQS
jgi:hypothetical protein